MSQNSMNARLEAQVREVVARTREADSVGNRPLWLALNRAWVRLMKLRLA